MAPRCLIVDDSDHFREAARRLLDADGIAVVGEASTVAETLDRYSELRPDVVLIDIDLGEECGFDLARKLVDAAAGGPPCVVMISAYDEQDFAEMIAASPAIAFLSKLDLSGAAIREILRVAAGGRA
ncbi:LytR/AlgR family response regulator transcription factor [Microtetraspora malaysiensis]|uniref:LytR/AlgR family response regulator transcription factor n=1 Tax=Microtetraspora malaysiensis TaxID=161358 RepID=UPI003D8A210B